MQLFCSMESCMCKKADAILWSAPFRLGKLGYDQAAAAQLQAAADTARVQVQRCKDHVDQLSSTLTSAQPPILLPALPSHVSEVYV